MRSAFPFRPRLRHSEKWQIEFHFRKSEAKLSVGHSSRPVTGPKEAAAIIPWTMASLVEGLSQPAPLPPSGDFMTGPQDPFAGDPKAAPSAKAKVDRIRVHIPLQRGSAWGSSAWGSSSVDGCDEDAAGEEGVRARGWKRPRGATSEVTKGREERSDQGARGVKRRSVVNTAAKSKR